MVFYCRNILVCFYLNKEHISFTPAHDCQQDGQILWSPYASLWQDLKWYDEQYKKAHLEDDPFGGASHAKGLVLEKVGVKAR